MKSILINLINQIIEQIWPLILGTISQLFNLKIETKNLIYLISNIILWISNIIYNNNYSKFIKLFNNINIINN